MMMSEELFLFLTIPCICTERQLVLCIDFVLETWLDACIAFAGTFVDCLGFPTETIKSSTNRISLLSQGLGSLPRPLLAFGIKPSHQSEDGVQDLLGPFLGLRHNRCQGHSPVCVAFKFSGLY